MNVMERFLTPNRLADCVCDKLTQRWGIFEASPPKVLQAVLQGVYYVVIVETKVAGYFVLEEGEDLHLVHSE